MSAVALVTGAGGQDGAYLCRDLLDAGCIVHAALRPGFDAAALWRLRELGLLGHKHLQLLPLDVRDADACVQAVRRLQPQQLFHLAAVSSVAAAAADPSGSVASNGMGTVHLLQALAQHSRDTRFVLASSGEIFVPRKNGYVDETCALHAPHAYALSKLLAHAAVQSARSSQGLHASAAVLFNHESPLRGAAFVTRKIAAAAVRRAAGEREILTLGNLDAQRDFGYAPDYVAALQRMAQRDRPEDFVFASGQVASIREFATQAYAAAGIELQWWGAGTAEIAVDAADGRRCIEVDPALLRRADAPLLRGDARRAQQLLGLQRSLALPALVQLLVEAERSRLQRGIPA